MMTNTHFLRETDEYIHNLFDNSMHNIAAVEKFEISLREEIEPIKI